METISRFRLSKNEPQDLRGTAGGYSGPYSGKMERWNGGETIALGICADTEPLLIKLQVMAD